MSYSSFDPTLTLSSIPWSPFKKPIPQNQEKKSLPDSKPTTSTQSSHKNFFLVEEGLDPSKGLETSPKHTATDDAPTLPPPNSTSSSREKRKRFGTPFLTTLNEESSGPTDSGLGGAPPAHSQLIIISMLENVMQTFSTRQKNANKTIHDVDFVKQKQLNKNSDALLQQSIQIAKENQNLSYMKTALDFITASMGIGGGLIVASTSATTGNFGGLFYGIEMTLGGLLRFGSFYLDQIGLKDVTWKSLMAIGGSLLTVHGGLMGNTYLSENLGAHLATITSTTLSLLGVYGVLKETGSQEDSLKLTGKLTELNQERKISSDDLKQDLKALKPLEIEKAFNAATTALSQESSAVKKINQQTLSA